MQLICFVASFRHLDAMRKCRLLHSGMVCTCGNKLTGGKTGTMHTMEKGRGIPGSSLDV